MGEWVVKGGITHKIYGDTLQDACNAFKKELANFESPDSEGIVRYPETVLLRYDEGIFGGKGGVVAELECTVHNSYIKTSKNYKEYEKTYQTWIYATKKDLYIDRESTETIKELRDKSKLSQQDFSEKYNIPVATIRDWEQGRRKCPEYVVELLKFKVDSDYNQ